ncbi:MAG: hypothetical protein EOP88_27350, partial [Verrucomicrobiaceae bacterium]
MARPDAICACHAATVVGSLSATELIIRRDNRLLGGKTMEARPNQRLSSQAMAFVLAGGRGS